MSNNETAGEYIDLTDQPAGEFTIYRDGVAELPPEPSPLERFSAVLGGFTGKIALQVRMAAYDARYGTHYRSIRNELVREQRHHEFERRIGLIAIDKQG